MHYVTKLFPACLVALSACAPKPSEIVPTYVSPTVYADFDCNQMNQEAARLNARLTSLYGTQTQAANTDAALTAVTLLVFWPALFALPAGSDDAAEIASLRGQGDALMQAAIARGCNG